MARRTKEEALETRNDILDAAELLFSQQGVSRTTLHQIAAAAGVSRGAIYWHFQDKSDLFNAMMERATMPLESALQSVDGKDIADPIGDVRNWLLTAFRLTAEDLKTRRVFEIATHKVEYVDELMAVRDRHLVCHNDWLVRAEGRLKLAIKRGVLERKVSPRVMALGLWAIVDGLIRIWLLDPDAFNLQRVGRQMTDSYIDSLRPQP